MSELMRPAFIKDYGIEITQGETFALDFLCKPESDQGVLYLEDTTGYSAVMKVRQDDALGALQLDASAYVTLGYTPGKVARNTAYGLGQKVVPAAGLNGYVYECVTAGTSHASIEPTWPTTLGNTVTDGTVTWRCETVDGGNVANVHIEIPYAVTAALTDWGRGVWALSVRNPFGNSWFYVDGPAYLRKSSAL